MMLNCGTKIRLVLLYKLQCSYSTHISNICVSFNILNHLVSNASNIAFDYSKILVFLKKKLDKEEGGK